MLRLCAKGNQQRSIEMTNHRPKHYLLLGAGFSRNWGGWLASEADEYLLGHPEIDKPVRDILWQYKRKGGFEAALAHLQHERSNDSRLQSLQNALRQMFADMDKGFRGVRFDFNNELKSTISGFLTHFEAIFTLNQDLLLERHYLNENVSLMSNGRWNGYHFPGLKLLKAEFQSLEENKIWVPDETNFNLPKQAQPYFKLHGSANWQTADSGDLLVMGGNKSGIIAKYPLLKWYHDQFKEKLSEPNARLMVIGYGFADDHINKTVQTCVKDYDLKIFIIDPMGTDVIDKNRNNQIYAPDPLVQDLWPNLIGASRRSLRDIFGTDRVEYEKIMRFFE